MALALRRGCEGTVDIDAPLEDVWALVSDMTRCRGRNHRNVATWTRICEVVAVEKPRRFVWRTLPTTVLPDSTEWRVELQAEGNRTRLTESFRILQLPSQYERLFALMLPQHRERTADLQPDLKCIKQRLEARRTAPTGRG